MKRLWSLALALLLLLLSGCQAEPKPSDPLEKSGILDPEVVAKAQERYFAASDQEIVHKYGVSGLTVCPSCKARELKMIMHVRVKEVLEEVECRRSYDGSCNPPLVGYDRKCIADIDVFRHCFACQFTQVVSSHPDALCLLCFGHDADQPESKYAREYELLYEKQ